MKQALIIGGFVAVGQLVYTEASLQLFSATSGQFSLPGPSAVATWQVWVALAGFIAVLLALFLL